jgi:hypothetical protein
MVPQCTPTQHNNKGKNRKEKEERKGKTERESEEDICCIGIIKRTEFTEYLEK